MEIAKNNVFASQVLTDKTLEDAPKEVSCPFEVEYIWEWFRDELNPARPANGMTICPLTHSEITAWAEGMQINLTPFERQALRAIDQAFISYFNSKDKHG